MLRGVDGALLQRLRLGLIPGNKLLYKLMPSSGVLQVWAISAREPH
jgi:hypothetical protein